MDFKNLFKKKNKEEINLAQIVDFDVDSYKSVAVKSEIFTDVAKNKYFEIPLICAGKNGVYVFVITKYEDEKHLLGINAEVSRSLEVCSGVFIFIRTVNKDCFVNGNKLVEIDYMLDKFENLYYNNLYSRTEQIQLNFNSELDMLNKPVVPEDFLKSKNRVAVDRVSSVYLKRLSERIKRLKDKKTKMDTKFYYKDGVKYVRHPVIIFGVITGEEYYPTSDEDPWKFLLLTVFGGIFGVHKFKAGEFFKGIGYILSCGCFGIGYLTDIFSILTGTYFVKQVNYSGDSDNGYSKEKTKIYVDELDKAHKFQGWALMAASIGFVVFCFRVIYSPILSAISYALVNQTM